MIINACERGSSPPDMSRGHRPKPITRGLAVCKVNLDPDEAAGLELCGQQRRTGAAERVKHEVAGAREALDEWRENVERFLCRMEFVAGIFPFEHIWNPVRWLRWIALRQ